ncbi:MAG TPA: hypothetical protein VIL74_12920 [Pyrinomonadaceae bacterium]|jgi:hypothetical protein
MKNNIKNIDKTLENYNEISTKLIDYETAMMGLYRELELKANQWQLLKALIIASNGKTEFNVSFTELDNLMIKTGKGSRRAGSALKSLQKWQDENKIELIRVIKPGHRKRNNDGTFEYLKTSFKFILFEEIATVFYSDNGNFEAAFDKLISKAKAEYKETDKWRKHTPQHNLRKAKRTIKTKFRRVFELSMKAGLNPINECRRLIEDIQTILFEIEDETTGNDNKAKFIKNFESKLINSETLGEVVITK